MLSFVRKVIRKSRLVRLMANQIDGRQPVAQQDQRDQHCRSCNCSFSFGAAQWHVVFSSSGAESWIVFSCFIDPGITTAGTGSASLPSLTTSTTARTSTCWTQRYTVQLHSVQSNSIDKRTTESTRNNPSCQNKTQHGTGREPQSTPSQHTHTN